jgi:hypothetical protein
MPTLQQIVDDLSKLTVREAAALVKMLEKRWSDARTKCGLTVLFERRARTQKGPLRRGEGLFEFYDSCARHGYDELRSIVNGWLAQMPDDDRDKLITRMRYGGDREFGAALTELLLHAFILGSGYRANPHPEISGSTKHPDYAVTDWAGSALAYVEVTTVSPSDAQTSEINRENPVYNAINAAKIPAGSALGYKLVRAGKTSPPLRPLVADVERWSRDNAEVAKTKEVNKTFTTGDWAVELDLYSSDDDSEPTTQAIGVAAMRGGMIEPHRDLRAALEGKSRRYGTLDKPYLIAVADGKDQYFSEESVKSALTEAVLGDEIVQFRNGAPQIAYAKNGFWYGPQGTRNRHVSGVLLLPDTGLWKLRDKKWQPVLAANPWAERVLPGALRTIRRFEADDGRWVFREGKVFADVVGLPNPWPPVEAG